MNGNKRIGTILLVILIYAYLAMGCGRKGDLYLPDRSAAYHQQSNHQNPSLFINKI